jgi:dihydrofolate reductase
MRNIAASFFMSIDGVVEAPEAWQGPYFDEEMGAIIGQSMASSGGFLLGRHTYEQWAGFWPQQNPAQNPVAPMINQMPKYVVSNTLEEAAWQNSTLVSGDVMGEVAGLKQQDGGDLLVSGSATLVRGLIREGLLDELRILVHPVLVGQGARLFEADSGQHPLELVDSQRLASGVINVTYRLGAPYTTR